jgi:hypothetical protein
MKCFYKKYLAKFGYKKNVKVDAHPTKADTSYLRLGHLVDIGPHYLKLRINLFPSSFHIFGVILSSVIVVEGEQLMGINTR